MNASEIAALVERLERATGADRWLDAGISRALGFKPEDGDFCVQSGDDWPSLEFTASLDATIALVERVLPRCDWKAERWCGRGLASINSKDDCVGATPRPPDSPPPLPRKGELRCN